MPMIRYQDDSISSKQCKQTIKKTTERKENKNIPLKISIKLLGAALLES